MYESFYGFREKPFSLLPDSSFLYLGKKHSVALSMLQYGLENHAGITVITGEIGCGKTTLIRHILDQLDHGVTVGLITNTHRSFGELLQWVLLAYDLEYRDKEKVERYQTFVDFLISEYAQNRHTVLIVDEAQNMDVHTIEELRLLSNVNVDKHQVLQLVLVGQPELRTTLRRHDLRQFAQRVSVDYHLDPLDVTETREYVQHRIKYAGGNPSLFRSECYDLIHRYSQGIPRSINMLCDTALVYAYGAKMRKVSTKIVDEVVHDRARSGLFEIQQQVQNDPDTQELNVVPHPSVIPVKSNKSPRVAQKRSTRRKPSNGKSARANGTRTDGETTLIEQTTAARKKRVTNYEADAPTEAIATRVAVDGSISEPADEPSGVPSTPPIAARGAESEPVMESGNQSIVEAVPAPSSENATPMLTFPNWLHSPDALEASAGAETTIPKEVTEEIKKESDASRKNDGTRHGFLRWLGFAR